MRIIDHCKPAILQPKEKRTNQANWFVLLVENIGFEPMTYNMPC